MILILTLIIMASVFTAVKWIGDIWVSGAEALDESPK